MQRPFHRTHPRIGAGSLARVFNLERQASDRLSFSLCLRHPPDAGLRRRPAGSPRKIVLLLERIDNIVATDVQMRTSFNRRERAWITGGREHGRKYGRRPPSGGSMPMALAARAHRIPGPPPEGLRLRRDRAGGSMGQGSTPPAAEGRPADEADGEARAEFGFRPKCLKSGDSWKTFALVRLPLALLGVSLALFRLPCSAPVSPGSAPVSADFGGISPGLPRLRSCRLSP